MEKQACEHLNKIGVQMDEAQKTFKTTLDKIPTGLVLLNFARNIY